MRFAATPKREIGTIVAPSDRARSRPQKNVPPNRQSLSSKKQKPPLFKAQGHRHQATKGSPEFFP